MVHNTYNGGHIETDNHVIYSIAENTAETFTFPKSTHPVLGNFRGVLDNDTILET